MNAPKSQLAIFLMVCVIIAFGFAESPKASESITFASVVDNLDLTKKTALYVEHYWKGVKGQEVSWSGIVAFALVRFSMP